MSATMTRLNLRRIGLMAAMVLLAATWATAKEGRLPPTPLPQPTEAQLGAPVYPGATYEAQISGGMSQGESYYWVFVTADSASKVAAFYKAKTGVTPTEMEGMFMFTFNKGGESLLPRPRPRHRAEQADDCRPAQDGHHFQQEEIG